MSTAADVAEIIWYTEDSTQPLTVARPAAFGPDEVLVFVLMQDGGSLSTLTAPGGANWTVPAGTPSIDVLHMRAKVWVHPWQASEPSTWDFGYDSTSAVVGALFRLTRADTAPTVKVEQASIQNVGSTFDSPTITPTSFDDLLLSVIANFGNGSAFAATTPSGMTSQGQQLHPFNGISGAAASEQLLSSSPTGVRTWTGLTPTGEAVGVFSIAVRTSPDPPPDLYLPGAMLPPPLLFELVARQRRLEAGVIDTPKIPARTDLICSITAGNFGTGNWTTGSITPPSSSLVVIVGQLNENAGPTTDPQSTFTLSDSGGHVWTAVPGAAITSDPTNFPCVTKVWTTQWGSSSTVTLTFSSGGRQIGNFAVSGVAYTGYDTNSPIGAIATGQSASPGSAPNPVTITLNAAPATSSEVVAGMGADRDTAGVTEGNGWLEGCDSENVLWGGLQTQFRNDSPSTAVSWVDIRAGGGNLFKYAAVAVEIKAAPVGGNAPAYPFATPRSAFAWRGILPRRARAAIAAPPQVVVTPPAYVAMSVQGRLRYYAAKRFKAAVVVPAQQTPATPPFVPAPSRSRAKALFTTRRRPTTPVPVQATPPVVGRLRLRLSKPWRPRPSTPVLPQTAPPLAGPRPRVKFWQVGRGRSVTPTPVQITATAPAYPPASTRLRPKFWQAWRGHNATPVPTQTAPTPPAYPPAGVRAKLRFWKPWRSRAAPPVPAQVVVAPPAYPPTSTRLRVKLWQAWRGHSVTPVPPQVVVTPPAYPPAGTRLRLRFWKPWRARTATPTPAQAAATPPAYPPATARQRARAVRPVRGHLSSGPPPAQATPPIQRRWRITAGKAAPQRRPRTVAPPVAQAAPPLLVRIKLRFGRLVRGKTRQPVPAQIILIAPPYPPQSVRTKRQMFATRRRRSTSDGWMVHSCFTTRPGTGITSRPSSGVTTYALAMTTRPSSGVTARPDTGITEDEC